MFPDYIIRNALKQFGFYNPECDYMEDFSSMTNIFFLPETSFELHKKWLGIFCWEE